MAPLRERDQYCLDIVEKPGEVGYVGPPIGPEMKEPSEGVP